MNNENRTTSIKYLDTLEGFDSVKEDGKVIGNVKLSISDSVINEANVIFFILIAVILYPGTIKMLGDIQVTRYFSTSPLFFLFQSFIITVSWIVISRLYTV